MSTPGVAASVITIGSVYAIEIATQIAESRGVAVSLTKRPVNSSTTGTLQSEESHRLWISHKTPTT